VTLHLIDSKPITPALGSAQSIAFHPSGNFLAVANTMSPFQSDADGKISLFRIVLTGPVSNWHLGTSHALSTGGPGTHDGIPGALAFSSGGHLLALVNGYLGNGDGPTISLFCEGPSAGWAPVPGSPFSFENFPQQSERRAPSGFLVPNALAFAPGETQTGIVFSARLAVAGAPSFVWLFDASSATLAPFGAPYSTLANTSWPSETGVAFSGPPAVASAAFIPPLPLLLATANGDGSATLFLVEPALGLVTGSPFPVGGQPPPLGNNTPWSIAFSTVSDVDLIAVAIDGSGVALLIPSPPSKPTALPPAPPSPFATGTTGVTTAVAFSADGKILAATNVEGPPGAQTGSVSLFEVKAQPFRLELVPGSPFPVGPTPANAVAFSPTNTGLFAVASGLDTSDNGSVSLFLFA
jgi:hypothetical protein